MKPKAIVTDSYRHGIEVKPDMIGWHMLARLPDLKKEDYCTLCMNVTEDDVRVVKFYGVIEVVDRRIKFCT